MPKNLTPILLLSLLLLPVALPAQEPAAGADDKPEFEGLVEVSEVLLDVLATDRDGNVVTGLGKDDFIVEEDGEPVPVTGVTFYSTRYGADGEAAGGETPASRYFILFFQDQTRNVPSTDLLRRQLEAGREAEEWVEEKMLPSDWVAVASYDVKLKVHQDFTQDRQALAEAIEAAVRNRDPEKGVGREGRRLPPSGAPSLLRHLPAGKELRKETTHIEDGIRLLAEASGYIVGRKNLLLFGIGFGRLRPGIAVAEPDQRYYSQMERALNDHNVAVYPIDLVPPGTEHVQSNFLSQLATDTGGYYYSNFVNFQTPITQISEENAGYYLLSYQSEHPADESGYQEVKVRARDGSVKIRARKGYRYGTSE